VVLDPFFGSGTTGAVAKKTGRRWIGIERDPRYMEAARQRIAGVEPAADLESLMKAGSTGAQRPRLPFGRLLEAGLLQPGQALFLHKDPARAARIRPDGHLELDGLKARSTAWGRACWAAPATAGTPGSTRIQPAPCTPSTTCARPCAKHEGS